MFWKIINPKVKKVTLSVFPLPSPTSIKWLLPGCVTLYAYPSDWFLMYLLSSFSQCDNCQLCNKDLSLRVAKVNGLHCTTPVIRVWSSDVYHMCRTCVLPVWSFQVYYMYITSVLHVWSFQVYYMCRTCILHVWFFQVYYMCGPFRYITCIEHVYYMCGPFRYITCIEHLYYMFVCYTCIIHVLHI